MAHLGLNVVQSLITMAFSMAGFNMLYSLALDIFCDLNDF
jgi:hypothetical protein